MDIPQTIKTLFQEVLAIASCATVIEDKCHPLDWTKQSDKAGDLPNKTFRVVDYQNPFHAGEIYLVGSYSLVINSEDGIGALNLYGFFLTTEDSWIHLKLNDRPINVYGQINKAGYPVLQSETIECLNDWSIDFVHPALGKHAIEINDLELTQHFLDVVLRKISEAAPYAMKKLDKAPVPEKPAQPEERQKCIKELGLRLG